MSPDAESVSFRSLSIFCSLTPYIRTSWKAIKWSKYSDEDEDIEQLLRDCDLGAKIHANANTLSGGQKRKLQLAIGM